MDLEIIHLFSYRNEVLFFTLMVLKYKELGKYEKKIIIIVIILIVSTTALVGIRYIQYNELLGEWIPINDVENYENDLYGNYKFTYFGNFTHGNIENKKCDLWGCNGYEDGTYKIYNENGKKIIKMRFEKHSIYYVEYKIVKEDKNIYLITTKRSMDAQQIKYKKK